MKITKLNATKPLLKLMNRFNLEEMDCIEWRDKYGKLIDITTVGLCCYKRDLDESVDRLISKYEFAKSKDALKMLKKIEKLDNHYASYLGYREYEIIKVNYIGDYVDLGVTIRFKDNGETRNVIETSLSQGLRSKESLEDYIKWYRKTYFTAGGLKDSDVDFLFHGVGHSSKQDLYTYDNDRIIQFN